MRCLGSCRGLAVLLLGLVTAASAQTPSICALRALRPGRLTRIRDTTQASVIGPIVGCTAERLTLGYYPGQVDSGYAVSTDLIRVLWARDNQSRSGLLIGLAAGAMIGAGIAAVRSNVCFHGYPPVPAHCHGNIVVSAAVVGAGGGLLGFVLGHGFPRWSKIFP